MRRIKPLTNNKSSRQILQWLGNKVWNRKLRIWTLEDIGALISVSQPSCCSTPAYREMRTVKPSIVKWLLEKECEPQFLPWFLPDQRRVLVFSNLKRAWGESSQRITCQKRIFICQSHSRYCSYPTGIIGYSKRPVWLFHKTLFLTTELNYRATQPWLPFAFNDTLMAAFHLRSLRGEV